MEIKTTRIAWVDALKGFAILLVVLGHSIQEMIPDYDQNMVFRYIYSFHMPLFMFLSGYVSYKVSEWNSVVKRFWQLMVPFFSAIVLNYLIHQFARFSIGGLGDYFVSVILRPDRGLWFLWVLFFIHILFIGCRKVAKAVSVDERIVVLGVAGILNLVELLTRFELFGYHWIAWYFIFFTLGAYWRISDRNDRPRLNRRILIANVILFPILAGFFRMHNQPPPGLYRWIDLGPYFPVIYRLVVALSGIALSFEFFRFFCKEQHILCKLLMIVGSGTLGIYYLHFCLLSLLSALPLFGKLPVGLSVLLLWLLTSAGSYGLVVLLRKNRYTQLLILGNNTFGK